MRITSDQTLQKKENNKLADLAIEMIQNEAHKEKKTNVVQCGQQKQQREVTTEERWRQSRSISYMNKKAL